MNTDELLGKFMLDGSPVSCEPYGNGHINSTFLVQTEKGTRYILQRLSEEAFKDVPALMENISGIAQYLDAKAREDRRRYSLSLWWTICGTILGALGILVAFLK